MKHFDKRVALGIATVGVVCLIWLAVTGALIGASLSAAERQAVAQAVGARAILLIVMWALSLIAVGVVLNRLVTHFLQAPARLAEEAAVLLETDVKRQLVPTGSVENQRLAHLFNQLVQQRETLRAAMDARVAEAIRTSEQEKNRFAALMTELPYSVVVCNREGRILLYNNRARLQFRTLSQAPTAISGTELIGLGRSIYSVFAPDLLDPALAKLQRRLQRGAVAPSTELLTTTARGQLLRVHLAAVRSVQATDDQPHPSRLDGFILMLEHVDHLHAQLNQLQHAITTQTETHWTLDAPHTTDTETSRSTPYGSRPEYYDFDLFQSSAQTRSLEDCKLSDLAFTVFDTETTGLDPVNGDEIIQIAAVRIVNGKLLRHESFDQYVDPQRSIPPHTIPIHGITPEMVKGQPTIDKVLPAFHQFAQDTVLVAHNAAFDMRCLQVKEKRTGVVFANPVLDTLLLSAVVHPNQASHRLEAITERFNINILGRHTALGDALATAEVFLHLIPLLAAKGIQTLGQARAAAQQTYYARLKY